MGIQLYHHYTDTSLVRQVSEYLSLYSEFQRANFNGIRKRSLYWLGHLGAIYQRFLENFLHIPPEKTFKFAPWSEDFCSSGSRRELHFVHNLPQMVASENEFFMRTSPAFFQNVSPSGSRWGWRFGECHQKKSLQMVADEKGNFRTALWKICKINNSAQVGQNF